ncbi:hypothetical protein [Paenibacillus wulumuqiensis]|uniref:hypothetical protein n=1 Tax=Paenibacillus wulumuqiensis TaxID=1567107 RepID=UPI0006194185|nr:hypothetical protein [Paenibacillus wulumuqiensis]
MRNKKWIISLTSGIVISGITIFVYAHSFAAEMQQVTHAPRQQVETYTAPVVKSDRYPNMIDSNVPLPVYFNVTADYKLNIPTNLANKQGSTSAENSSLYQDDPDNPITVLKRTHGGITGKDNQLVTITYGLQDGKSEIRVSQSFNEGTNGKPVTIEAWKKGFDDPATVLTELEINGHHVLTEETNHIRRQVFLFTNDYFYAVNNAGGNATMEQLLYVASQIKVN